MANSQTCEQRSEQRADQYGGTSAAAPTRDPDAHGTAAILLFFASGALSQVQAPDKAYIEQTPRGGQRPSISAPLLTPPQPAARPGTVAPNPAAVRPARPLAATVRPATTLSPPPSEAQRRLTGPSEPRVHTHLGAPGQTVAPQQAKAEPASGARPAAGPAPASGGVPPAPRPAAAAQTTGGACLIRVGTFSQRANADSIAKAIKPLGEVRVDAVQVGGKSVHLVILRGLRTRQNAEATLARLKAGGHKLGDLAIAGCRG